MVTDLYSRRLIDWSLQAQPRTEQEMGISRCRPPRGLIYHSDRGTQYASHAYRQRLVWVGLFCS
jgi:transposase InsO family protein